MKYKITKIPPLRGTTQQQVETLRKYCNLLADEITRALEAQEREIERLRKEIEKK